MKCSVACNIEHIQASGEEVWILSISSDHVADAAMMLSGLFLGKVERIKFADKTCSVSVHKTPAGYQLNLGGAQIAVTKIWLKAVLAMLVDSYLNGWSDTAHLDQQFDGVSVTAAILPPGEIL